MTAAVEDAAAASAAATVLEPAAPKQPQPQQPQQPDAVGSSVAAAIEAMAAAVQNGDFAGAEAAGAAAALNLAMPHVCLSGLEALFEGAQASVYRARLAPASLLGTLPPDAASSLNQQLLADSSSDGSSGAGPSLAVAVKKARIREGRDLERFRREVALLAALRHPNIVRLLGARLLPPGYLAVLQLEAGNAAAALHDQGWRPSWAALLALGAQLAAAVEHLHAAGYVHRDIKPDNLLLSADRRHARLADLGLAASAAELASGEVLAAKPTGGFHKQHMVGTLQYMAPEVLLGRPHSPASDVFALAVTLNELATGIVPYSDCTRDNPLAHTVLEMGYGRQELAAAVAAEGLRPLLRPDTPAPLRALLDGCWERQPAARPSAAAVAQQLRRLAAEAAAAEAAAEGAAVVACGPAMGQCWRPAGAPAVQAAEEGVAVLACGPAMGRAAGKAPVHVHIMADSGDADMADAAAAGLPSGSAAGSQLAHGGLPNWLAAAACGAAAQSSGSGSGSGSSSGQPAGAVGVSVGSFKTPGRRDAMEDTLSVLAAPFGPAAPGCTAVGVFDGHRGAEAADYLAASLAEHLRARLGAAASGPQLLAEALADADAAFRAQQDAAWADKVAQMGAAAAGTKPAPGATASLLLIYPAPAQQQQGQQQEQREPQQQGQQGPAQRQQQMLAVANLGDSRVVLCRDGQALQLTRDHTADLPDERQRVVAAGGAVSVRAGNWRVGEAGLQVTRSVGDADLKPFVSAEAEAQELALTAGDDFVIAATDGLWDRLSNEEAVALVQDTVKHPAMCAQRLCTEALARGGGDNVAVVVAFLNTDGGTAERVYHQGHFKYGAASARRAAVSVSADEMQDTY